MRSVTQRSLYHVLDYLFQDRGSNNGIVRLRARSKAQVYLTLRLQNRSPRGESWWWYDAQRRVAEQARAAPPNCSRKLYRNIYNKISSTNYSTGYFCYENLNAFSPLKNRFHVNDRLSRCRCRRFMRFNLMKVSTSVRCLEYNLPFVSALAWTRLSGLAVSAVARHISFRRKVSISTPPFKLLIGILTSGLL